MSWGLKLGYALVAQVSLLDVICQEASLLVLQELEHRVSCRPVAIFITLRFEYITRQHLLGIEGNQIPELAVHTVVKQARTRMGSDDEGFVGLH